MTPTVSWPQALAWRMRRHGLDPIGAPSVPEIVGRLCGIQAQVPSSAELAVRVRQVRSCSGEVAASLEAGEIIRTWAMRGTLHLLTPREGPALLSLLAAGRSWERPSWQRYFGMTPAMMERLREATRQALDGRTLSREELIEAVTATPGLAHIAEGLRSGWGTLLKPLAWQGELCFGPSRGNRTTFMHPGSASSAWPGIPSPEEAAPRAILAYLGAYGPTTVEAFARWLAGGWFGRRQLRAWFEGLRDEVAEVDVDGERLYVRRQDLPELLDTEATNVVRLLPGFDQYVLGPGTGDVHVLAAGRRAAVSRQSGWIAPVVVAGGVVSGTWELDGDTIAVEWFGESGSVPEDALGAEAARMGSIVGRDVRLRVSIA